MRSIGQKIMEVRRSKGIRGEDLGAAVGLSKSSISKIENEETKGGPDPETVVKIAEYLNDRTILTTYLEQNPVYRSIIPKIFPDLNNIRRDPAIVFSKFAGEARESEQAALILAEVFSAADPFLHPNFRAVLHANMQQIIDVQRCSEVVVLQLIAGGIITELERAEIYEAQQRKCEEKGHHKPDRTGAEG